MVGSDHLSILLTEESHHRGIELKSETGMPGGETAGSSRGVLE